MRNFLAIYTGTAAAELFENHRHFTIFPGEAVETMPRLPTPELQGVSPCDS